jgi:hypothetical protein
MKLSLRKEPLDGPDWLFELKHDGFRCLAYIADSECKMVSRHHNVFESFKLLQDAFARTLKVKILLCPSMIFEAAQDPEVNHNRDNQNQQIQSGYRL